MFEPRSGRLFFICLFFIAVQLRAGALIASSAALKAEQDAGS